MTRGSRSEIARTPSERRGAEALVSVLLGSACPGGRAADPELPHLRV